MKQADRRAFASNFFELVLQADRRHFDIAGQAAAPVQNMSLLG